MKRSLRLFLTLLAVLLVSFAAFSGAEKGKAEEAESSGRTVQPAVRLSSSVIKTQIGNRAVISAKAINAGSPVSYQWQYSNDGGQTWINSGVTGSRTSKISYTVTTKNADTRYRCLVTAAGKTTASEAVTVFAVQASRSAAQVQIGKTVTYSVRSWNAGSGGTFRWQYSKDNGRTWTDSSATGSGTAELTVRVTEENGNNRYRCRVSGSNGTVYSKAVYITPAANPSVNIGPAVKKARIGSSFTFTANVKDALGEISYQWQYSDDGGETWKNFTDAGGRTARMPLEITSENAAYRYRCKVTNGGKTAVSNAAIIYAAQAVRSAATAAAGETAFYTVKVWHSGGDTTYQWQYSKDGGQTWINSGATGSRTAKLSVRMPESAAKLVYRCKVTGKNGTVYSNASQITLRPGVSIGSNIRKTQINKTLTFTATVKGAPGIVTYQWQFSTDQGQTWKNFTEADARSSRMALKITAARAAYRYRCRITTGGKAYTSNTAIVYAVQVNRSAAKADIGKKVTYSADVWHSGGDTTYQWQYTKDGGKTWTNSKATGSKTAKLVVTLTENSANTQYRCKVTGKNGTIYSRSIYVTPNSRYFALVIANSDYHYEYYCPDLPDSDKDGTAMVNALKAFGYHVKFVQNQTASGMRNAISGYFNGKLSTDICLVYYIGHGDNGYGLSGGSLVGVDYGGYEDLLYPTALRDTLLNNTKGRVTVLLDACGSDAAAYDISGQRRNSQRNFVGSIMNAFNGFLAEDPERNTGELPQKRFTVLAACEYGKAFMDIYYTKTGDKVTRQKGSAFTYSLLYSMGCSYPNGVYRGKIRADADGNGTLTLQEGYDGILSRIKMMNSYIASQTLMGYFSDGTPVYFCYDENGSDSYGSTIDQVVQKGGSAASVLFGK